MRFSSTRYSAGGRVVTLTPVGEIDLLTAGALRAAIEDTLRAPHPVDVVVDLAGVTFLDCAGIGTLVAGRNLAIRRGCDYTVVNPQRRVRRVLDLAGVLEELTHLPKPVLSTGRSARSPRPGRRRLDQRAELAPPAAAELRHVRVALTALDRWPAARRATIVARPQQANHLRWTRAPAAADCDRVFAAQMLDEQENPGEMTLHLLRGQIRPAADGATSSGSAGKLLIVLGAWHTLQAGKNAAPLLTIAKPSPLSDPGT